MDESWVQYRVMLSEKKQDDTQHHRIIRDLKRIEIRAASR